MTIQLSLFSLWQKTQLYVQLYLKLSDNGGKRWVFPALFIQQRYVVVKLADVGGVHLQVGTLLDKDVWQSLVIAPVTRETGTKYPSDSEPTWKKNTLYFWLQEANKDTVVSQKVN